MYTLSLEQRSRVIQALCEGNSIRATGRLTGAAKGTITRLLAEVGTACRTFHDQTVRGIKAKRVQCDEIWSFCYAKSRNVPIQMTGEAGDVWTWVAIDQDSKLVISWAVGDHNAETGYPFVTDLASRLANRIQLTTDGLHLYRRAVEQAFGYNGVDYAQLVKIFASAAGAREAHTRYSPAPCIGTRAMRVTGRPLRSNVTTSHIERQNLTLRMQSRRYTRLTNAFSKKVENHIHATALYIMHYNFCRPHQALTKKAKGVHRTPAMEAGLVSRVWTAMDLVRLLPAEQNRRVS